MSHDLAIAAEFLERRELLAAVTWDGAAGDNNWQTALNWSSNALPTSADDVVFDVPDAAVTINHAIGATSIHSLQSNEALTISGGTLAVATTIEVGSTFQLSGGAILGGTVTLTNGAKLVGTYGGTLDGVTLNGDLDLTYGAGAQLTVRNGRTLNGTATLGQNANYWVSPAVLAFEGGSQTLAGNGTFLIRNYFAALDRQQLVPLISDVDEHLAVPQQMNARSEQPDQVHDVLPFHVAMIANIGLHLLELREDIAVERLIGDSRQEAIAHGQQFSAQRRRVHDQRRVQALKDIRVRLQGQRHELLQLPVTLLSRLVFQSLRHAEQRPMQFGRWQVHAAQVGVRCLRLQPVSSRSDDDFQNHPIEQSVRLQHLGRVIQLPAPKVSQHHHLIAPQRRLKAVGKADSIRMLQIDRRLHDHANRSARMSHATRGPNNRHFADNLRADRVNQIGLQMSSVQDGTASALMGCLASDRYRPTRSHDALTDGQKPFQATRRFWLDCRRFRQRSRSLIVQHGQKAGLATYSVCFFR